MKIEKIDFFGIEGVAFEAGGYEAILVPSMGANLVKLYHKETQSNLLHTPQKEDFQEFLRRPQVYGVPVLFPPNRIADGKYKFENRIYQYPITIPKQHNYHHGILKSQPFTISKTTIGDDYVEIQASYFSNCINDAIFHDFPHEFECRMIFNLSSNGLEQTVIFVNDSEQNMPLGMGYHTPICIPYQPGNDEYKMWLSAGLEWKLNERGLPTEELISLQGDLRLLRTTGMDPVGRPIECALSDESLPLVNGDYYNGAIFVNLKTGVKVFYEVDEQFRHWTLWNNGGDAGYICPEPQTWAINAPNLSLDEDTTGFQIVEPGDAWSATTKLYVK